MSLRNILVTLPKKKGGCRHLRKKIRDAKEGCLVHWEFKRMPKQLARGCKLYVACEGFIRGYFYIGVVWCELGRVDIYDWHPMKKRPIQSTPGFRYATGNLDEH